MKKAFTLAEIMIVLSVIAIITAILLPSARNAMPNEDLMKFKKGHNALYSAICELVNSDKYYLNGDLGIKPNGDLVHQVLLKEENGTYFCKTLADVMSTKFVDCTIYEDSGLIAGATFISGCSYSTDIEMLLNCNHLYGITQEDFAKKKQAMDKRCKQALGTKYYKQIISTAEIYYWKNNPSETFGATLYVDGTGPRLSSLVDKDGFSADYQYICMDIDGVPESATADDCVNECPFGYGVRVDGKILNGAQADEWLNKSIQDKS